MSVCPTTVQVVSSLQLLCHGHLSISLYYQCHMRNVFWFSQLINTSQSAVQLLRIGGRCKTESLRPCTYQALKAEINRPDMPSAEQRRRFDLIGMGDAACEEMQQVWERMMVVPWGEPARVPLLQLEEVIQVCTAQRCLGQSVPLAAAGVLDLFITHIKRRICVLETSGAHLPILAMQQLSEQRGLDSCTPCRARVWQVAAKLRYCDSSNGP